MCLVVELSLNSVVGLTARGTFKVKGTVEDHKIISMVDYGATHYLLDACQNPQHPYGGNNQLWGYYGREGSSWRRNVQGCHGKASSDDYCGRLPTLRARQLGYGLGYAVAM